MALTATQARANLYRLLDSVHRTGKPIEIVHRGKRVQLAPVKAGPLRPGEKLASRLKDKPGKITGTIDELIHFDWSKYWNPG